MSVLSFKLHLILVISIPELALLILF